MLAVFPHSIAESMISVGNVLWIILFGWILYLGYALVSVLMYISIIGIPYGTKPSICPIIRTDR